MPSTYSPLLRTELPALGEQAGTWNTTINTDIGTLLEAAISGTATVALPAGAADYTLTAYNGAADEARCAVLKITATLTANRNVIVPSSSKLYLVYNATSGAFTVTVKTAAGTGIAVTQGQTAWLYCDGTNVVRAGSDVGAIVGSLTGNVTGNVTGTASGNLVTGGALGTPASGNLSNCTNIPGAQVTGTVASATSATTATTATSATTATTATNQSGGTVSATTVTASSSYTLGTTALASVGTPTIASGFGTGASIVHANGSFAFYLYIGTGGTANYGTITMPMSATSWLVIVNEPITTSGYATNTRTFGSGSGNTVTLVNETINTHASAAWESGRYLSVLCVPMN